MAFSSNSQFYYYFFIALVIFTIAGCGGGGGDGIAPSQTPTTIPTISGSFTAAAGSFIDSDVNDPLAPYSSNNITPQDLDNPFIVGGYASLASDAVDRYQVALAQGQTLTLSISDYVSATPGANDLDLYLFDPLDMNNPISTSLGSSATESIAIAADGTYILEIRADSGSSNYVLTVSASSAAAVNDTLRLEDDFIPGEIIIQFNQSEININGRQALNRQPTLPGLKVRSGSRRKPMLYTFADKNQRRSALTALGVSPKQILLNKNLNVDVEISHKFDTIQAIKTLRKRSDILSADLNYRRYPAALTPNDQYYPLQWHYSLINLPQAWDFASANSTGSSNITVAIVDTGVFMAHTDLTANLLATGYDFISNPSSALDGDGIDSNPDDPGDNATPGQSTFHGTHVAGTVAAATNNGAGPNMGGVAAVSWDGSESAKIMPIRVLGVGGGTSFDVIRGVRYAAGLDSGLDPSHPDYPTYQNIQLNQADRADIINLSLTGAGYSLAEQNTFNEIRAAGVLCIAAAGNKGSNIPQYPASYNGVISVSAVDSNKQQAWYSNFGSAIDVAAPGGDISVDNNGDGYIDGVLSTSANDASGTRLVTYRFSEGTSMATPHVSGVAALMKSIHPGSNPTEFADDFESLLNAGSITEDLGTIGRDDIFGFGLIDALKAVQEAKNLAGGGNLPPVLAINPTSLQYGTDQNSISFSVTNGGGGNLSILSNGITSNAAWLTVSASNIDGNNLGTYTASVDRFGLAGAFYSSTITVETDIPETIQIPVSMQVNASGGADNDVGFHYVLLLDQATGNTITELNASNSSGNYSFSFSDISPGTYYIVAGTDSDNDGNICDPGEACGGYPTITQLSPIVINATDVTGISFVSGFTINFSSSSSEFTTIPSQGYSRLPNKRLGR